MAGIAVTIIFYAEVPEWQCHYNLALDSLYPMATARFRLYVFFHRAFAAPLYSPLFDSTTPYLVVPLYMAHLDPVPPLQAQPPAPPPPHVGQESSESDPSEPMDSSSSSPGAPDDDYTRANSSVMNGFLSSESI